MRAFPSKVRHRRHQRSHGSCNSMARAKQALRATRIQMRYCARLSLIPAFCMNAVVNSKIERWR